MQSVAPLWFARNEENESIYRGFSGRLTGGVKHEPEMIVLTNNDVLAGPGWLNAALREIRSDACQHCARFTGTMPRRYFLPNGNWGRDFHPPEFDDVVRKALPTLQAATEPADAAWCLFFPPK